MSDQKHARRAAISAMSPLNRPKPNSYGSAVGPQAKRSFMTDTKGYPYATHLDIKFPALDLIDVEALARSVTDQWYNQTLCRVNDSVVRLGVMQGEYHWHKHDSDDEFFFVLSGRFIIDLEGRSVDLLPGQGFVVPKGTLHRTRAPERSVILMVETAAIVPTGDEISDHQKPTTN
jgi:mannose-6-phosphate isomerase-like protein (cupin superfamily)